MVLKRRMQHIAVFGESGSGKTVLLSSFYGATQEPSFLAESLYRVRADDQSDGRFLRQNYLGLKKAKVPETTRLAARKFSFTVTLKEHAEPDARRAKSRPFDALQLIWHDYPGEWFEEEPTSEIEKSRRVSAFRNLLESDVAVVLVDGQKLLDNKDQEEKYLRSLLWGLSDGLERLNIEILTDGKLRQFPRIWIIALAKADLHPDLGAREFCDLVTEKNAGDVTKLHETLKDFVHEPEALSVGEDFMLISSAKFELSSTGPEPVKIEVNKRLGVDLMLPIASMLPLERLAQWYTRFSIPIQGLGKLVDNSEQLATLLTGTGASVVKKALAKVPKVGKPLALVAVPAVAQLVGAGQKQLEKHYEQLRANQDYLGATLARFQLDLDRAVADDTFLRGL
jgi:hypothetical protein